MKRNTAILLAASMLLAGCGQSKQDAAVPDSATQTSSIQAAQDAPSEGNDMGEERSGDVISSFNDARIYCLGMILYATKNQNLFPTNLDQTLPYLREANQAPSGTNRFDILYWGSLDALPSPMISEIIVLRSGSWEGRDGKWSRVYGFADGHCEIHTEADDSFDAWEKRHMIQP